MKLGTVEQIRRFRAAAIEWAAGGAGAHQAGLVAHGVAGGVDLKSVVLVEGASDQAALETLAARRGRHLAEEGVAVVPLGGATSIGRFLELLGPLGLDLPLSGLCDVAEQGFFRRSLERTGVLSNAASADLEAAGFFVCVDDLEDELIRTLGTDAVQRVIQAQGEMRAFRTFQNQPAQRLRPVERQLRRFMGSQGGRKFQYARALVGELDLDAAPRPLDRLLAHI
ncbi:TOPRIM nucleotidyl transferase/hydrolase domain-containing protein [Glaciibacter sp. 2TAF33]|uniref:TOPRIM nucleotidyl transferase/hydrolase domain-containing protein n=1 Tax=Glaciibacter sp. 2TAF33 TaxID=3233015 RepID=UPI003F906A58